MAGVPATGEAPVYGAAALPVMKGRYEHRALLLAVRQAGQPGCVPRPALRDQAAGLLLLAGPLGRLPQAGSAVTGALRRPVMAHWVCRGCEAGGSDIETPGGPVRCWLCAGEVIVTARVVQTGQPII
jgi:hypothetical protein